MFLARKELETRGLAINGTAIALAKRLGLDASCRKDAWAPLAALFNVDTTAIYNWTPKKQTRKPSSLKKFNSFYETREWRKLRFQALLKYGRKCLCCNATDKVLHVDHVKPRSKFPELELDINNLQILCEDCNMGKGGWSQEDFRPASIVGDQI